MYFASSGDGSESLHSLPLGKCLCSTERFSQKTYAGRSECFVQYIDLYYFLSFTIFLSFLFFPSIIFAAFISRHADIDAFLYVWRVKHDHHSSSLPLLKWCVIEIYIYKFMFAYIFTGVVMIAGDWSLI